VRGLVPHADRIAKAVNALFADLIRKQSFVLVLSSRTEPSDDLFDITAFGASSSPTPERLDQVCDILIAPCGIYPFVHVLGDSVFDFSAELHRNVTCEIGLDSRGIQLRISMRYRG
jgi:hypothetical protein